MGGMLTDYRRLTAWGAALALALALSSVLFGPVMARHRDYDAEIERCLLYTSPSPRD